MNYFFKLNSLYFNAIKNGSKTIETRPSKESHDRYTIIKKGDEIIFTNNETEETLHAVVVFVHHYHDLPTMFKAERIENILPNIKTVQQAMNAYNMIEDYKERIREFGIFAYGIKVI